MLLAASRAEQGGLLDVLLGGDGDKLLGCLGDVVRTLDDLLRDQLHVLPRGAAPAFGGARLATLPLQTAGAGGQQAQRAPHDLRAGLLGGGGRPGQTGGLRGY